MTHWEVEASGGGLSLLRLTLETGRTHQIRVHMAWLGCPLAGDSLYGGALEKEIGRTALHAGKVRLVQPFTGEVLEFEVPLPRDMERLAARRGVYTQKIVENKEDNIL